MAKTPQEWRSEWEVKLYIYRQYQPRNRQLDSARKLRRDMSNCVLGYAHSRGWYHV